MFFTKEGNYFLLNLSQKKGEGQRNRNIWGKF